MIGKFNLAKLKISAYPDNARNNNGLVRTFEAMFNPESISQKFKVKYSKPQAIGAATKQLTYVLSPPTKMGMKLVFDHSLQVSALESGITYLHNKRNNSGRPHGVRKQVEAFLAVVYDLDGANHQPRWLRLEWGDASFDCRLVSVEIKYTGFDRSGVPIAAELDILLKEDINDAYAARQNNFQSPDVTHSRIVKVGDTLPLLSQHVYGNPSYYTLVAQANNLDDFRNLQPGAMLYFPPLT